MLNLILMSCFNGYLDFDYQDNTVDFKLSVEAITNCPIEFNEFYTITLSQERCSGNQQETFVNGITQVQVTFIDATCSFANNLTYIITAQYIDVFGIAYNEQINPIIKKAELPLVTIIITAVILILAFILVMLFLINLFRKNKRSKLRGNDYIMAQEHRKIMILHQKRLRKLNPGFLVDFQEIQPLEKIRSD